MKQRELAFAGLGLLLLLAGAVLSRRGEVSAAQTVVEAGGCRLPLTILQPSSGDFAGSAVVFHGISANRGLMDIYGEQLASAGIRVFLPDLPGHGDNTQPFSFERAEKCATLLVLHLQSTGEISPSSTILAGHSMGGAIAIRIADHFPAAGTLAISPAPMIPTLGVPAGLLFFSLPARIPGNLLVLRGRLEPEFAAEGDQALIKIANQGRLGSGLGSDSLIGRPAQVVLIPGATHTGILFDPSTWDQSVAWARDTLHLPPGRRLKVHAPALGGLVGLAGIFLLFPVVAALLTKWRVPVAKEADTFPPIGKVLAHSVAAFALGVLVLRFWVPLRPVRILMGDYLASFLLLGGLYLLLVFRGPPKKALALNGTSLLIGGILSFALLLGAGAWLNWRLDDAWMNAARWARFVPLAFACLPYFAAEEVAIGPPRRERMWARYLLFAALRALAGAVLVLAFLLLHSGQLLIILLAVFLALISVFQRIGMDSVRRCTGSTAAAAVFGAILAGWFLAAVLPLT
ncbi:MAG TPA: alpha/beta hydrolase [Candidatus Acidoferrales bacterium]